MIVCEFKKIAILVIWHQHKVFEQILIIRGGLFGMFFLSFKKYNFKQI